MKENFYIDNWLIQPQLNRVSLNGEEWKLEPKIMQVLCELASTPSKVVTRDHLFDTVWENTVVVDMVLTRAISELRSIFKDSPTAPKVIETIPKGGYRLIASVQLEDGTGHGSQIPKQSYKRSNRYVIAATALVIITLIAILAANESTIPLPKNYTSTPLTALQGWEFEPDISPDGKSVAFLWRRPNENFTQICTKTLGGTDHKVLTKQEGFYFSPKWSPNGDQIAFYTNKAGVVSIGVMPAFGGKEREIIRSNSQVAALSWSPDGNELAYVERDTSTNQHAIFIYSFDDQKSSRVTTPPLNHWGDGFPRFSKDGKHIAFIRTLDEGMQDLYQVNLKNKELQQLTNIKSNIYGFDWTNRSGLILSSDYDGQVALWERPPGKNASIQKMALGKDKRNPSISGSNLVMEEWNTNTDLWKLNLADTSAKMIPLLQSTKWDLNPNISRNGKKVVFSSNQSGSYEIWSANADGGHLRKLTNIKKSLTANPKWSPKGDMVTFDAQADDFSHIYLVDSSGTDQYQFTRGSYNDMAPSWSPEGDFIYFASDRTGDWEVWKKPTNGNNATQVTTDGGFYACESPDGSTLFFTKRQQHGLWSKSIQNGEEKLLIEDLNDKDWGNWEADQNGIYYLDRLKGLQVPELRYFNLQSETIDKRIPIRARIPGQDATFSISSDGSWAIFGHIIDFQGDLVHVNNL